MCLPGFETVTSRMCVRVFIVCVSLFDVNPLRLNPSCLCMYIDISN
jgi:hypothetical protein